ncbi:MAG TPA: hypothetical protein PKE42_11015 [Arachnia sp.]|jgi:hypothetical protein|nr:hypothetical protein [Arachnia sp.]
MGLLDKILGRGSAADDTPGPFDCERVKAPLAQLVDALGTLADTMGSEEGRMANPGWRGRVRDLNGAQGELKMLARRTSFEREDLMEILVGVRPLYRGTPPGAYAHLAGLNDDVVAAIEAVHAAAR